MARVHKLPRSSSETAYHRREITRMYLHEKMTQDQIADKLKISQATVSRALRMIRMEHAKDERIDYQGWQNFLLTELLLLKEDATSAWEKSQSEKTAGNAAFIREARENIMAIRKVLGMDVMQIAFPDFEKMSDEELEGIAKRR